MLKNVLKKFQMSEQNRGCLDKMSEVNFSPAESLLFHTFLEKALLSLLFHSKMSFSRKSPENFPRFARSDFIN